MFAMVLAAALSVSHAGLPAFGATSAPVVTRDPAAEIAHALAPRESLRAMILMALERNGASAELIARVGESRADAMLSAAAETVSWRHAAQWEANLAAAYRESLSADELGMALAAVRRADRVALGGVAPKVGIALFRSSAPLIEEASAEAIRAAQERLTP